MNNIFNKCESSTTKNLIWKNNHLTKFKNSRSSRHSFQDERDQIKSVNSNQPKQWEN